jgi:hypothetical protein
MEPINNPALRLEHFVLHERLAETKGKVVRFERKVS